LIRLALEQRRVLIEARPGGGWDISPPARFLTSAHGPIIFVIHGYNNDQEEAETSYGILRENLREILGDNRTRLNHIWELYWPGYLPKGTLLPWRKVGNFASVMSYPYQEQKTTKLGAALAEYIGEIPGRDRNSGPEVIFVAHSLGCRVVMETLRNLDQVDASVRVLGVCLMAAAVPVFAIEPGGHLRSGAHRSNKVYILYSSADSVLRWVFRPGQFLAHLATFPEAVGRFGNPFHGLFTVLDNVVDTGLEHGDYYRGRPAGDPGPNRTRTTIGRLFGRPQPDLLRDNYLVEWPPVVENHLIANTLIGEAI
jgi:pimeloyl-ACP methyl ester carboxylesterase